MYLLQILQGFNLLDLVDGKHVAVIRDKVQYKCGEDCNLLVWSKEITLTGQPSLSKTWYDSSQHLFFILKNDSIEIVKVGLKNLQKKLSHAYWSRAY